MKKLRILLKGALVFILVFANTSYTNAPSDSEIAVIVNKGNTVEVLSVSEAKLYFLRKLKKRWPDINKNIRPADRKRKCAEQDAFYLKVLGMDAGEVEQYFVNKQLEGGDRPQDKFGSEAEMINFVAEEPGAIGYVSVGALTPEVKAKVKVVLTL